MRGRRPLVLSLFPGLDLLGRGFEAEGACVVTGPDVVWGRDVRGWWPVPGKFDGVIGGPPCQAFSRLAELGRAQGHEPRFGNLIPDFERCVEAAGPAWWLMENVPDAPVPAVERFDAWSHVIAHADVGGRQMRERRFTLGLPEGVWSPVVSPFTLLRYEPSRADRHSPLGGSHGPLPRSSLDPSVHADAGRVPRSARQLDPAVTEGARANGDRRRRSSRMTVETMLALQDAPEDLLQHSPFTMEGKRSLVGNAVPVLMARALARLVFHVLDALEVEA